VIQYTKLIENENKKNESLLTVTKFEISGTEYMISYATQFQSLDLWEVFNLTEKTD
jgi:hypothetical protein